MSSTSPTLSVAVFGAGAVGCYYGGMLARAGHRVTLIGRPQHVQAVQAHGLRMQTLTFDEAVPLAASTEASAVAGADLVLFAVKSPDTETAGEQMRPHLAPGALVLCLQNGVDNAERLRALLPGVQVAAAVVYVATVMAGPGHLRHQCGAVECNQSVKCSFIVAPETGPGGNCRLPQLAGGSIGTPGQVFDGGIIHGDHAGTGPALYRHVADRHTPLHGQ
jgi:ketopantoate reductase